MAYNLFSLEEATEKFALSREEMTNLFAQVAESRPGQAVSTLLEDHIPLALAIGNEKARSELIIAPVLTEARRLANRMVSFFSGVAFDVAPELGLNGYCDFIFSRSPELFTLKAPALMIVEAKQENIPGGFGQCIAEMVAAQIFNARANTGISTIYGAVTTGDNWKFLKLEDRTVFIDLPQYHISQIGKILGIMLCILQPERGVQVLAA